MHCVAALISGFIAWRIACLAKITLRSTVIREMRRVNLTFLFLLALLAASKFLVDSFIFVLRDLSTCQRIFEEKLSTDN